LTTIYPDTDYSNVFYIEGKNCTQNHLRQEFFKAIRQSRKENKPIKVDCIIKIIRVKD
jgi:hypothetical protein